MLAVSLASADNRLVAEAAFGEFVRQDFAAFSQRLSPQMNAEWPPDKLERVHILLDMLGPLRSLGEVSKVAEAGLDAFTFPGQFEHAQYDFVLSLDAEERLAGLRWIPRSRIVRVSVNECKQLTPEEISEVSVYGAVFGDLSAMSAMRQTGKTIKMDKLLVSARERCESRFQLGRAECTGLAKAALAYYGRLGDGVPRNRLNGETETLQQRLGRPATPASTAQQTPSQPVLEARAAVTAAVLQLRLDLGDSRFQRLDKAVRLNAAPHMSRCAEPQRQLIPRSPSSGREPIGASPIKP